MHLICQKVLGKLRIGVLNYAIASLKRLFNRPMRDLRRSLKATGRRDRVSFLTDTTVQLVASVTERVGCDCIDRQVRTDTSPKFSIL